MIESIIFDMDGVIVDSEIQYIKNVQKILRGHGVDAKLEDLYYIGGGPTKYYNENIAKFLNVSPEIAAAYHSQYNIDFPTDFTKLLRPEAVELLDFLYDLKYPMAIASSGRLTRIMNKLDQCNLHKYFDVIVSGEQFKETKPNPEIFLYTAKQLNVDPSNCMVIEDSTMGITAGYNAGMCVVALRDSRFNFDTSLATYVVDNLLEVKELINNR